MKIDLKHLPSDIAILQRMILNLSEENQSLKDQLAILKAKNFGSPSEKLKNQIEEIELRIESNELDLPQDSDIKVQRPKRLKIADHLPRENIILNPDPECPDCGGHEFRKISDDVSETLEYIPASFKVIRHIRPCCVCIVCEKIVQAFAPSKAIDKGVAGPGLLAHILVQKYCNHLPMYRQSQMYHREGVEISRNTMTGWARQCADLLNILVNELKRSIFASKFLHGDDTPVKVLAPDKTKVGRIWAYVRDGRSCGDTTPPAVVYFYTPDRKGIRPEEHLKDFSGILHADSYAGYNNLYKSDKNPDATIEEAACWAHTRRKFYEITVANTKANIAISVLEQISLIYKLEADVRGLEPDKRLEHRQNIPKNLSENYLAI